ncbi:putative porin [Colwellia sp. E2M01]|uniref:putative porin n=1 Tax=Colwellia sp. E2M01 TaxID=2841561 RepID=UPI001C091904|nr:putative porin [Colwellia sp. E2M01]MBU2870058.1 putative porin [Colwellia sp. E2M01]
MKKTALFLGLSLLSSAALANNYNTQIDFDYLTADNYNEANLVGTYYFNNVSTANTAWSEAAFMGRNDNVSLGYTNNDGDAYSLTLGGDYYHENIFLGLDVTYTDVDGGDSDTGFTGEVGYFFAQNWLVSVSGSDEEFSDSLALNTKYIAVLSNGAFVNVEASYLNADSDFTAAADYFWTAQSSVGLSLKTEDDYNVGINAEHFFTPAIAANIEYVSYENDDTISVGLTGRF